MCGILRVIRCRRLNPFFMWQDVLTIFLQDYSPTDSILDSTEQYSTPQLHTMLETASGESILPKDIIDELNKRGFKQKHTGNLNIEWLMKPIIQEQ